MMVMMSMLAFHQMVWGQLSTVVMDRDDEQIIQCLKHVRPHDYFFASRHDCLGLCRLSL
jgi:hypothetical protein